MNWVNPQMTGDRSGHVFLVAGCGSIGKRHMANLKSFGAFSIMAVDPDPTRREEAASRFGAEVYESMDTALGKSPKAAVICTPSSLHLQGALAAAKANCHLFVEKPLSNTTDGIDGLLDEVEKRNLVTMVGCNFKFHPSFIKMKEILDAGLLGKVLSARCQFGQYLPDWHPWEDYRRGYSARSELGGGILLDSHEFDYIQWFMGDIQEVFCLSSKLSDLEIDTEDTAEVLLRFKGGAIAEIHLDYTQRSYQRNYEFFGDKGSLKWDVTDRRVWLYLSDKKRWELFEEPRNYDFNEMYLREMQHFMTCMEKREQTLSDIHTGWKTLRAILAAKASSMDGKLKRIGEVS
jgi:predicted dehydrogenase